MYVEDPLSTHTQGTFDAYDPDPDEEPVESTDTDGELLFKLYQAGLITSNYLLNQDTGQYTYFTSVPGRTASTVPFAHYSGEFVTNAQFPALPPVDVPIVEQYQYSWAGFSGGGGGTPTPTPTPDPDPSPTPGDSGSSCEPGDNSVGCADRDDFIDDLAAAVDFCALNPEAEICLDVSELGTVDSLLGTAEEMVEGFVSELTVDLFDLAPSLEITLPASSVSCPAIAPVSFMGSSIPFELDSVCQALDWFRPVLILMASIFSVMLIIGRQ